MIIQAKQMVLRDSMVENAALHIQNGTIRKIFTSISDIPSDILSKEEVVDYGDSILAPGLVDTHIHGFAGHDVMDRSAEGFRVICRELLRTGVTSFLPTTLTAPVEDIAEALRIIHDNKSCYGAKARGIFLEGPFFTEAHKGAQNSAYFLKPDSGILKAWQKAAGGLIKKASLAPELEGTEQFIKEARAMGVFVALGHSDASYDEAIKALEAGANIFVHTFNGMRGFHHREPGMVGAALSRDEAYAEVICDGHHVHPAAVKVLIQARGFEHVILISDCMMAGGMPAGTYKLGDFDVIMDGEMACLKEGNLAGSVLRLCQAVKNLVSWKIATPFEAIQMATQIPARSVGIDDVCGIIEEGREADLCIFDRTMDLTHVYLHGEREKI